MNSIVLAKTWQRSQQWLAALWKFSRPHTIIGTSLSVVSLALITLSANPQTAFFLLLQPSIVSPSLIGWQHLLLIVLGALIPSLCANLYIVGLNQLEDVAIDRINKPDLPLASGEFTRSDGQIIVGIAGIVALGIASLQGYWLLLTVGLSMGIGTAYSLPPIRLKQFPFWAALCIFGVRGLIVNLGFFLHFQHQFGETSAIPAEIWALTGFIVLFAFAIAIFKDIPDTEGDRQFQISTLTLQLGSQAVFNLGRWVLTLCYGGMIIVTMIHLISVQLLFSLVAHASLLGLLWIYSLQVDLQHKHQISQFYQFIWKLFFLEYLIFPIACLWN
jgi:homogentisate phytyltransferase / homogentisate geranylgeranyltransferase